MGYPHNPHKMRKNCSVFMQMLSLSRSSPSTVLSWGSDSCRSWPNPRRTLSFTFPYWNGARDHIITSAAFGRGVRIQCVLDLFGLHCSGCLVQRYEHESPDGPLHIQMSSSLQATRTFYLLYCDDDVDRVASTGEQSIWTLDLAMHDLPIHPV